MLEEIHMNFREKVKALLEAEDAGYRRRDIKTGEEGGVKDEMTGKSVKISGPHDAKKSKERVEAGKQRVPKSMMQAVLDKLRALDEESQNENSNHPFYQKVKELSRNKKNNSLLEKKSNIIRLVIARLKPNGEKSKMDEVKKDDKGWNKARKQRKKESDEGEARRIANNKKIADERARGKKKPDDDDISDRPDHPNRLDDDPDDFWSRLGTRGG